MSLLQKLRESLHDIRSSSRLRADSSGPTRYRHISLDLETLSFEPNAVVLSIGAVCFDLHTGEIGPQFQLNVDPQPDSDKGGHISESTVEWWIKPENAVAYAAVKKDPLQPIVALGGFDLFLGRHTDRSTSELCIWTMGSEFDPPIINQMAQRHGFKSEFPQPNVHDTNFINRRHLADVRTVIKMFPSVRGQSKKDVAHVAVTDALAQADFLIRCRRQGLSFMNPLRNLP